MYESRAFDNEHGNPVVVLVTTGTHDVSRLVQLLQGRLALTEHIGVADRILRQVKRHNGGRAALELLKAHGGPDFTGPEVVWWVTDGDYDHPELYGDQAAARGGAIARYQLDNPERTDAVFTWQPENPQLPGDKARELHSDGRRTGLVVTPVSVRVPVPQPQKAGA